MQGYRIEFVSSAYKAFGKMDAQMRRRIEPRISALATNPRPVGAKRLSATEELYRIRVGAYRVIYRVEDGVLVVLVLKLGHRRDVYRGQ